jgi:hypothetical protein
VSIPPGSFLAFNIASAQGYYFTIDIREFAAGFSILK